MDTRRSEVPHGDEPVSPLSHISPEESPDLTPTPQDTAPVLLDEEAVGDTRDLHVRGLVRNPLGGSLLSPSLQHTVPVASSDSHDASLNINSLDPAALHDLITTVGGVPPLSPASEACSSEDYSTADSSATADTTATSDLSWQSAQSETTFETGHTGAGDITNTQTWNGKSSGARPKDRHLLTRQMRKKKREELKQRGDNPDNDDHLVAQLKHLALGEKARDDPPTGTGLYYEEIMLQHKNEWDPLFPECPQRLSQAFARCCDLGLVDRCVRIESMYATEELIGCLHSQDYMEKIKNTVNMNLEELRAFSQQYDSVYVNNMTYECGLVAVGGVVEMTRRIAQKKIRNGLALVRPPGHHAEESEACGFSIFNNAAIAAKIGIEEMGLSRVLIVDWDVHHGQATQNMFYDDPRVLYFSIHRYEHGKFWPHLRESDYDYIGRGQGEGYNINVPLNTTGMGNSDYMAIFQQVLMPIAYEFSPELVLVSCGFDSALGCPEGEMEVTPSCFPHFLHMVSSLAEGCVSVILEGGYCIQSLAEGAALTLRELLGDPCPLIGPLKDPCQSVTESILNVIKVLRPFWKCLQYQDDASTSDPCPYTEVNQWPPKPGITFCTPENRPDVYLSENYCQENFRESYERDTPTIKERLDMLEKSTSLEKAKERSCLLFDADMRAHKNAVNTHPERPDRISRIFDLHVEWGLFHRCHKIQAREATTEELCLIHRQEYVGDVAGMANMSPRELNKLQDSYNSVYLCQASNRCARLATGGTLNVVNAVLTGKAQNGVAIVRPPGHHAESHTAMGFCFFNTVAVAAKYAQEHHHLKRVLIVDWDVHHGNGTQHVFDSDPSVLFVSLHRFDHGFFYPASDDANYDVVGFNEGEGFNVNIPFNYNTMGDAEYIAAFQQIIMPIAYEYNPELVLVSAGFDAARGDPLGGYNISPAGYGHMTHMLTSLANGRVILVLEGGYNLHSISTSMATCTSVLLGDPCPQLPPLLPCISAVSTINQVLHTHQKYWKSLKFGVPLPPAERCDSNEESSNENEASLSEKSEDVTDVTFGLEQLSVSSEEQQSKTDHVNQPRENATSQSRVEAPQPEQEAEGAAGGGAWSSATGVMKYLQQQGYDEMYAVQPVSWCPHLSTVCPLPERGLDTGDPCTECGNVGENWVCLVCYQVLCSRFVNEHMLFHGLSENHLVVLSYADLSVWCYGCDTYVDNPVIYPAKSSAHLSKFGSPLATLSS